AQFNNLVVANRGPYAVKVSDIGYVEDGAEEQRTEARLNGQPAVTLIVSKQSGQNTVAVADAVKERLAELKTTLPPDVKTQIVGDQTVFIKASLHSLNLHRGYRNSNFHRRDVWFDGRNGLHNEFDHDARADADGRHRDR